MFSVDCLKLMNDIEEEKIELSRLHKCKNELNEITVKLRKDYDTMVKHDQWDEGKYLEGALRAQELRQELNNNAIHKSRAQLMSTQFQMLAQHRRDKQRND